MQPTKGQLSIHSQTSDFFEGTSHLASTYLSLKGLKSHKDYFSWFIHNNHASTKVNSSECMIHVFTQWHKAVFLILSKLQSGGNINRMMVK